VHVFRLRVRGTSKEGSDNKHLLSGASSPGTIGRWNSTSSVDALLSPSTDGDNSSSSFSFMRGKAL
jgi:hypothetical protein